MQLHSRSPWLGPAIVFVLAAISYFWTLCPEVYPGDSGELATVAACLQIAHPPGYPLLTNLGRVVVLGAGFVSPIVALNSLAALCMAAACALFAALVRKQYPTGDSRLFSAWLLPLLLAFGVTAWSAATHFEVYALGTFLIVAVLFSAQSARQNQSAKLLLLHSFLFGLALTNHLSALTLAPVLLHTHIAARGRYSLRTLLLSLLFLVLPLTLYLYLPVRSAQPLLLSWGDLSHMGDSLGHITGQTYRQYLGTPTVADAISNLRLLANILLREWYLPVAPLAAIGFVLQFRRNRSWALALLAVVLLNCALGLVYTIPDIEPFLLPTLVIMVIWIFELFVRLAGLSRISRIVVSICALALVTACFVGNLPKCSLADRTIAADYARAVLSAAPLNSVLICGSDYTGFPVLYYHVAAGERPDLLLFSQLPSLDSMRAYFHDQSLKSTIEIARALAHNPDQPPREVVFTREPLRVVDDVVISAAGFLPDGLLARAQHLPARIAAPIVVPTDGSLTQIYDPKEAATSISLLLLSAEQQGENDKSAADRKVNSAVDLALRTENFAVVNELASYLIAAGQPRPVRRLLESAVSWATLREQERLRLLGMLGSVYFETGDLPRAQAIFASIIQHQPTDLHAQYHLLAIAADSLDRIDDTAKLVEHYRRMLDIYPNQFEIAFRLGRTALRLGDTATATQQFARCRAVGYRVAAIESLLKATGPTPAAP